MVNLEKQQCCKNNTIVRLSYNIILTMQSQPPKSTKASNIKVPRASKENSKGDSSYICAEQQIIWGKPEL